MIKTFNRLIGRFIYFNIINIIMINGVDNQWNVKDVDMNGIVGKRNLSPAQIVKDMIGIMIRS